MTPYNKKYSPKPALAPVIKTVFPFIEFVFVTVKNVNRLPKQTNAKARTKCLNIDEYIHPNIKEKKNTLFRPWFKNDILFSIWIETI